MIRKILKYAALAGVALGAQTALAAEPDRVVVRNRLYEPKGTTEVGVEVGASLINRLVSHDNFQVALAYNFTDEWAVEVFGGYALSSHSDVADQVNQNIAAKGPNTKIVDDFSGLWQMQWNAVAGVRWAPIYGKFNLVADVPVHFQAYLALGAGAAGLHRESVTYCLAAAVDDPDSATGKSCDNPLTEDRVAPVAHFGGGLRFWLGPKAALRLEARDYAFADKYQINIDRASAQAGNTNAGEDVSSPGFEHIVFLGLGVSYIF